MNFAQQLKALVDPIGSTEAGRLCGVTPRSIQLWLKGAEPNLSQQAGVLFLLGMPIDQLPTRDITPPKEEPLPKITFQHDTKPEQRRPFFGGLLKAPKK